MPKLAQLVDMAAGRVDLTVVVEKVGQVVPNDNGETRTRREVIVCDESLRSACLTLWTGFEGAILPRHEQRVVVLTGLRLGKLNKWPVLSFDGMSCVDFKAKTGRVEELKKWVKETGMALPSAALSGHALLHPESYLEKEATVAELLDFELKAKKNDAGFPLTVRKLRCFLQTIPDSANRCPVYKVCPTASCREKKVTETGATDEHDVYRAKLRCSICQTDFETDDFALGFRLVIKVADQTGEGVGEVTGEVTLFGEAAARVLFGQTLEELEKLDEAALRQLYEDSEGPDLLIHNLKVHHRSYQGNLAIQWTAQNIERDE